MNKNKNYKYHFDNLFTTDPKPCGDILLYQAGEILCKVGTIVPKHNQFCYEITYVLSGEGEISTNGVSKRVKQHDCYFSMPDEIHEIISDTVNPLRFCFLGYGSKNDTEINAVDKSLSQSFNSPDDRITSTRELEHLFSALLTEISGRDSFSGSMLSMLVKQTIITAYRSITKSCPVTYNLNHSNSSCLVYEMCKYIDNHIFDLQNLNQLQNIFNYNYQYLSRQFVKITGKTLITYYTNKKMDIARRLLIDGESATDVSIRMNYSSVHAFTRAYGKYFGYPPSRTLVKEKI